MNNVKKIWSKLDMKKKVALFTMLFLIVDQTSKIIIDKVLPLNTTYMIADRFIYITKSYNTGVAWSMLSDKPALVIIISIVIFLFLLFYMRKFKYDKKNTLAFSLIFGGLFGNLIDRIIYGHVIDFIDIMIFNYDYPIFNIADSFVFIGVLLLMWSIYLGEDNENSSKRK